MISKLVSWVKLTAITVYRLVKKAIPFVIPSQTGWKGAAYGVLALICLKLLITGLLWIGTLDVYVIALFVLRTLLMGFLAGLAVYITFFIYRTGSLQLRNVAFKSIFF